MDAQTTAGTRPTPKRRAGPAPELGPPAHAEPTGGLLLLHWQARIAGTLSATVLCLLTIAACLGWVGAAALIVGLTAARWL